MIDWFKLLGWTACALWCAMSWLMVALLLRWLV